MSKLEGLCPPIVTLFDSDGKIDLDAMKQHAEFLLAGGVDGLCYLGTSGEFGTLTQQEKLSVIRSMTPYINGRARVIIGIGDTCLANSLELAEAAEEAGADAVLVLPPYFSVYAEKNYEAYFAAVARGTKLPVVLYNFPALTGYDLSPSLVRRLAQDHPNIRGVKDTVPETEHLKEMIRMTEDIPDFSVFCAYETQALEMIPGGAAGLINATANFAPEVSAAFLKACRAGDKNGAGEAFRKMTTAAQVYEQAQPLLLAVKEAVYQKVTGEAGAERLPGLPLDEKHKEAVKNILNELSENL
ncbi:MAG: dihydrodipicolinate synthase family protein [Lachnospiraceae bacterium]|nr:dihydrodipicolinate synthase family protein [Lachnospiraceae bacterium]